MGFQHIHLVCLYDCLQQFASLHSFFQEGQQKVATAFYYDGKQYCLPFRALFKPDVLYWLMESAKLQMEDKIESITHDDEWDKW